MNTHRRRSPILRMLLLIALTMPLSAQSIFSEGIPEVQLEARTLSYYRPCLVFDVPVSTEAPLRLFRERLREDLALSGYLSLFAPGEIDSTLLPQASVLEWLVEPAFENGPMPAWSLLASLRAAEDTQPWGEWRQKVGGEGDPLRQADGLAIALLRALSGYEPVLDSRLMYVEPAGLASQLVAVDFRGDAKEYLTRSESYKYSPAWSPDGEWLAWVVIRPETGADLFTASLTQGGTRVVLAGEDSEAAPAWSPDGSWLACASTVQGNTDLYLLSAAYARGSSNQAGSRRLTFSPGIDTNPSWSPDSRSLVFSSDRGGSQQLYLVDVDGLEERRISYWGGACDCPAWSPDGEWIAFVMRESKGYQLFLTRPDGAELVRLSDEAGNHFDPVWSPDSQQLVYSWRDQVWICFADGTGRRRLSAAGFNPVWSPLAASRDTTDAAYEN